MNKADTNSLISDYLYHLRAGGKRLSVAESGPATTSSTTGYTHDDAGRLTQESGAYGTIAYTYDNVGNRLTRTVSGSATPALANGTTVNTYDANDWLASGAHFYDFDGNELLVNGVQASYDFENHLVQLGTRDYTAYSYDADGNRLSVATRVGTPSAGTPTAYLVDPLAPFARAVLEFPQGASYNTVRYEYGDDLLLRGGYGAASYYLYDGLGSTRQLTDGSGAVTDGYLYDAYGVGLARTGSTVNSFLFQGQQYDAASGTYYLRARYYDQNSGRFISQDPLEGNNDDPISLHRYLYGSDDPADRIDPGGQSDFSLSGISTTMAGVASFAAQNFSTVFGVGMFLYGIVDPEGAVGVGETVGGTLPQAGTGAEEGAALRGVYSNSGRAIAGLLARYSPDEWRALPGIARGGESLTRVTGQWLKGSEPIAGKIPGQIADALRLRRFKSFREFRETFWREVANDPELSSQFRTNSLREMRAGRAPYAPPSQQQGGEIKYQLHHMTPLEEGGLVYDMDNLLVTTPLYHDTLRD